MPLNGPREGSVALSLSLIESSLQRRPPPRSIHAPRMPLQNLLFHARHACLSTYAIPHVRIAPSLQLYLKIYFGRGPARLRSETNCRRRNIECLG